MKKNNQIQPIKQAKAVGGRLLNTVFLLFPAILGGAAGAGLGRNGLLAGGALFTLANQKDWPDWLKTAAIGMAVNGVATTKPLTETAVTSQTATVNAQGQLQGFTTLIPDNFMERGTQYLKNIVLNTYLDKVPVVNKAIGLAGFDEMERFQANQTARVQISPQATAELNRIMAEMQEESGTVGNIDAYAFQALEQGTIAGIDAQEFASPGAAASPYMRQAMMN